MPGRPLKHLRSLLLLLAGASLAACASVPRYHTRLSPTPSTPTAPSQGRYKLGPPYQVGGIWYVPREQPGYDETGLASWYGDAFQLQPTANGEIFDLNAITGAHPTLPLPSLVEVTNLQNGRRLTVRINDRGPFVGGRIVDLSHAAARELAFDQLGLARVRVRYLGPAPLQPQEGQVRYAAAAPPRPAPTALSPPRTAPPRSEPLAPTPAAFAAADPPAPLAAPAVDPLDAAASGLFRVQAGAFADPDNARRAADALAAAGEARIEAVQREGGTLYRVVLPSTTDESLAWIQRDRVAVLGFAEAKVTHPD